MYRAMYTYHRPSCTLWIAVSFFSSSFFFQLRQLDRFGRLCVLLQKGIDLFVLNIGHTGFFCFDCAFIRGSRLQSSAQTYRTFCAVKIANAPRKGKIGPYVSNNIPTSFEGSIYLLCIRAACHLRAYLAPGYQHLLG